VRFVRDLRRVRNEQRTRKRRADHSPFLWRFATPAQGREQPSGPASGRQSAPNRGAAHAPTLSVTPPKWVRARHRAPRLLFCLSASKSSVCRDLRHQASRTPVRGASVSTDNLALPDRANHRSLSRLPSRRQPFRSKSRDQSQKGVEKSLKFSCRLRVEFTAASTGLTLLAQVANTL
jgi:hypothetical protein